MLNCRPNSFIRKMLLFTRTDFGNEVILAFVFDLRIRFLREFFNTKKKTETRKETQALDLALFF